MKEKSKRLGLSALFLVVTVIVFQQTGLSSAAYTNLLSYLTCVDKLPPKLAFDAVYTFGGNQESLKAKYEAMAILYPHAQFKEITILSRQGITEYSTSLGRNLTNDEWSLMILEGLGVSKKNVQALEVESGFFGTYSEAECLSKRAIQRDWNSLLLISSPHHTKRIKKSFEYFMDGSMVEVSVIASKNQAGLFELMFELFKLKIYEVFLLTQN